MKHFINLNDIPDIPALLEVAKNQKANPFSCQHLGKNKTLGLIFFNSSLRTRISTQKAAQNLGLNVIVINVGTDSWQLEFMDGVIMDQGKAEHIREAAAVLGSYCDIIGVRAFAGLEDREEDYKEVVLEKFRQFSGVPIINLESATRHPCQSLADILTIEEHKTVDRPKIVLTWLPHFKPLPQAVANSFVEWVKQMPYEFVIANPEGYDLSGEIIGDTRVFHNQKEAFEGADFVYGKNWSSYNSYGHVLSQDSGWRITKENLGSARFMHCLPVRRELKVTAEVLDSDSSLVILQAANRVWSVQAVLKQILENV